MPANGVEHGFETVGAGRREMFAQAQFVDDENKLDSHNSRGCLALQLDRRSSHNGLARPILRIF
jgi:hypothetical protein